MVYFVVICFLINVMIMNSYIKGWLKVKCDLEKRSWRIEQLTKTFEIKLVESGDMSGE